MYTSNFYFRAINDILVEASFKHEKEMPDDIRETMVKNFKIIFADQLELEGPEELTEITESEYYNERD